MAVTGLVSLSQVLLSQGVVQEQNTPAVANTVPALAEETQEVSEDSFTPSQQSPQALAAQAAGLFTVAQSSIFSPAADLLLQTTPATTNAATSGSNDNAAATSTANTQAAPTAASTTTANLPLIVNAGPLTNAGRNTGGNGAGNVATANAGANVGANAAAPTTNNANAANGNNAPVATAGAPARAATAPGGAGGATEAAAGANAATANTATANAANTASTSLVSTEEQLQTLNNSLAALGLTQAQINQLDQIASIMNDFSPDFFTSMAYQLQSLTQNPGAAPAAVTTKTQTAATNALANTATNATTGAAASQTEANQTAANQGAFQVQQLVIRFTGTAGISSGNTAANNNAAAKNGEGGTSNLRIAEVNLTLANGNGQTVQVQSGAANTNSLTELQG